jgi:ribosomal protein S18 acetylase RimI-like enzyme
VLKEVSMSNVTQQQDIRLRAAKPDDARDLARLIEIAGAGIPTWLWSGMAAPGESPLDVGERRARREEGGFSYRNAIVADRAGAVVGMILAYSLPPLGEDEIAEAPEVLRPILALEAEVPDSWYINAFAIDEAERGHGTGSRLMDATLDAARAAGCDQASVQFFSENARAGAFYRRHGFREVAARPVVPHPAFKYTGDTVLLVRDI